MQNKCLIFNTTHTQTRISNNHECVCVPQVWGVPVNSWVHIYYLAACNHHCTALMYTAANGFVSLSQQQAVLSLLVCTLKSHYCFIYTYICNTTTISCQPVTGPPIAIQVWKLMPPPGTKKRRKKISRRIEQASSKKAITVRKCRLWKIRFEIGQGRKRERNSERRKEDKKDWRRRRREKKKVRVCEREKKRKMEAKLEVALRQVREMREGRKRKRSLSPSLSKFWTVCER